MLALSPVQETNGKHLAVLEPAKVTLDLWHKAEQIQGWSNPLLASTPAQLCCCYWHIAAGNKKFTLDISCSRDPQQGEAEGMGTVAAVSSFSHPKNLSAEATDSSAKWKLVTPKQVNMSEWGAGTENWRAFEHQNTVYTHDTLLSRSSSKVQYCSTAAWRAISRWENSYPWCWIHGPTHTCYYIAGPLRKNCI